MIRSIPILLTLAITLATVGHIGNLSAANWGDNCAGNACDDIIFEVELSGCFKVTNIGSRYVRVNNVVNLKPQQSHILKVTGRTNCFFGIAPIPMAHYLK